jgi:hypothetical protein
MHKAYQIPRLNSGFRREVDENCALLGYYAESSGDSLPKFRDNLSVPSSKVKHLENGSHAEFFWIESALEWGSVFSILCISEITVARFITAVDSRVVTVAIVVTIIITYLVFTNFLTLQDRTHRLSRDFGKELSLLAA